MNVHVCSAVVPGGAPGAARLVHDRRVGVQRRTQRRLHLRAQDAGERARCTFILGFRFEYSTAHSAAFTCSRASALNGMLVKGPDAQVGLKVGLGTAPPTAPAFACGRASGLNRMPVKGPDAHVN